jgi:uncharacterized protein YndB with AHSA1/START domain
VLLLLVLMAAAPSPASAQQAEPGAPMVRVARDASADAVRVTAKIDIPAPPERVWAVMTDCARAAQIVPNLKSCRVLERDPAGRWDVREHRSSWMWFMPNVRSVFRSDYDPPKRLRFRRIEGTLRRSEGEWRLTPLANGHATRVSYDAIVAADLPVPDFMVANAMESDIATVLRRLRAACTGQPPV